VSTYRLAQPVIKAEAAKALEITSARKAIAERCTVVIKFPFEDGN
jgi:hypothetical protein